jgi:hypothetical protein
VSPQGVPFATVRDDAGQATSHLSVQRRRRAGALQAVANGLRELDDNPPARSASYSWLPVYFYFLSAGRRSSQGLETSAAGFPVDCVAARQPIAARRVQFGPEYFMGAAD